LQWDTLLKDENWLGRFGVMTIGFLMLTVPTVISEVHINPAISHMGISQNMGNMEGKEVRFGSPASAGIGALLPRLFLQEVSIQCTIVLCH
jgi:K+-transporting ATPase A subunit